MSNSESPTVVRPGDIRLGNWSMYFLAKLLLYRYEFIGFNPLENLAFAAFLLAPLKSSRRRTARNVIAIPVAAVLLYHDSWLPSIDRVFSQASLLQNFSAAYLVELVGRFVSFQLITILVLGWASYLILAQFLRVGLFVMMALVALVIGAKKPDASHEVVIATGVSSPAKLATANAATDLDVVLGDFYEKEAQLNVKFPKAQGSDPFDIIFVHICSLSWDDLRSVGLDNHPLWSSFDFLFQNFNSAASYSGPAAIRINRATCGQTPHANLYQPVSDRCYLMPSLEEAGFTTNLAFNHDGHFDDFLTFVRNQGIKAPLMPLNGISIPLRSFDNSAIYDDYEVLSEWLTKRQSSSEARVALFYNTISLHDGNRIVTGPGVKLSSKDNYKPRLENFLGQLVRFMDQLQKSGRRAIVVMVPEHGAALRGDKFQISGLREIPTPAITTVPVGIKILGPNVVRKGEAEQIKEQTSYIALSQLLAHLFEQTPYESTGFDPKNYVTNLTETRHVGENDGTVMMQDGGRYFLKVRGENWKKYAPPQH